MPQKITEGQRDAAKDLARVQAGKNEAATSTATGNDTYDANLNIAKTQERWIEKPR